MCEKDIQNSVHRYWNWDTCAKVVNKIQPMNVLAQFLRRCDRQHDMVLCHALTPTVVIIDSPYLFIPLT